MNTQHEQTRPEANHFVTSGTEEQIPPTACSTITIGIVEDDPVLRECLGQMIEEVEGFCLSGSAATVAEGFRLLATAPDILLLDLALPDGDGLELIAHARDTNSPTRLLVLTVFADVRSVVRAIEEGADGYLLKEADRALRRSADQPCGRRAHPGEAPGRCAPPSLQPTRGADSEGD